MKTLIALALTVTLSNTMAASVEEIASHMNEVKQLIADSPKVARSEENGRPYGISNITVHDLIILLTAEQAASYTYAVMDTLDLLENLNLARLVCIPKGTPQDVITEAALGNIDNAFVFDPDAPAALYIGAGLYSRFPC